jgi:hypothetical protein
MLEEMKHTYESSSYSEADRIRLVKGNLSYWTSMCSPNSGIKLADCTRALIVRATRDDAQFGNFKTVTSTQRETMLMYAPMSDGGVRAALQDATKSRVPMERIDALNNYIHATMRTYDPAAQGADKIADPEAAAAKHAGLQRKALTKTLKFVVGKIANETDENQQMVLATLLGYQAHIAKLVLTPATPMESLCADTSELRQLFLQLLDGVLASSGSGSADRSQRLFTDLGTVLVSAALSWARKNDKGDLRARY